MASEEFEDWMRLEDEHDTRSAAFEIVKMLIPQFSRNCRRIIVQLIERARSDKRLESCLTRLARLASLSPEDGEQLILAWGEELRSGRRQQ